MKTINEILEQYDVRDLEMTIANGRLLVYEYIPHTQYEESGEFIADFDYADAYAEFEKRGLSHIIERVERI